MENDIRLGTSVSFWADDRQCRVDGKVTDVDGSYVMVDVDGAEYCIYPLASDVEFYL